MARALESTSDTHRIHVNAPKGVIGHWDARRLEEVIQNLLGTNHRPTGQRGFLMHYRVGSDVLIQDAFRLSNFNT